MIQKNCHATENNFAISKFAPRKTIVQMMNIALRDGAKLWGAIRKAVNASDRDCVPKAGVQGLNVMKVALPDSYVKRAIARKVKISFEKKAFF